MGIGPACQYSGKICFIQNLGTRRGGRHVAKHSSDTPPQGRARQSSGTGPCGECIRGMWVPGPRGQYSGKIRFIEKPGVQDDGGRHVAKVVLTSPSSRRLPREIRAKLKDGSVWGL